MADAIRVLLVDDEPVFVDTMSKVLKARGYAIGTAAGGVAALEELRFNRYDVVVLDLRMPGMDGIATLEDVGGEVFERRLAGDGAPDPILSTPIIRHTPFMPRRTGFA